MSTSENNPQPRVASTPVSGWNSAAGGAMPSAQMILVGPQMGENIGAAARGMWNFGHRHMRLVAPRDGWPNPRAVAMASGAGRVLDDAHLFATTAEAVADLNYVFATTARPRDMTKTVMTPAGAARHAHDLIASGQKVGFLFGRERTGLETEDVVRANAIVSVPVNPEFASLNLAQCVLLIAYEMRKAIDATPEEVYQVGKKAALAESHDVDRMVAHLVVELDTAGFFFPEAKRGSMLANLQNLFRRAPLTDQDVRTLHGVVRSLAEKRELR